MLWAIFGLVVTALIVSVILDIEDYKEYDGGGISIRTAIVLITLVALGISRSILILLESIL